MDGTEEPAHGDEANPRKHPITFLTLPRELRDQCYDYMTGSEKAWLRMKKYSQASLVPFPVIIMIQAPILVNILCVTRQVKAEYEKRMAKTRPTTAIFTDREDWKSQEFFYYSPHPCTKLDFVTKAEFRAILPCYYDPYEHKLGCINDIYIRATVAHIELAVSSLGNLMSMHVYLISRCMPCCKSIQGFLQQIAGINRVTQVSVYYMQEGGNFQEGPNDEWFNWRAEPSEVFGNEIPGDDQLSLRWTVKGGWVSGDGIRCKEMEDVTHEVPKE